MIMSCGSGLRLTRSEYNQIYLKSPYSIFIIKNVKYLFLSLIDGIEKKPVKKNTFLAIIFGHN